MTDYSEWCMCGSLISAHGMSDNHSPVPESHYRAEPDDRCRSCSAEVDHYLGCNADPKPDYEKEYASQSERDSMNTAGGHSEDRDD